jgi:hypothetical protein
MIGFNPIETRAQEGVTPNRASPLENGRVPIQPPEFQGLLCGVWHNAF